MKTIKQWLETLPSPIKEKALDNLIKDDREDMRSESLSDALSEAFDWYWVKEGDGYWRAVKTLSQAGDFDKKEEEQPLSFPREVYINDVSEEDALKQKNKRICLGKFNWQYFCVSFYDREIYKSWESFTIKPWKHIAEIPNEPTNITIETKDGQSIEISKKKARELWIIIN